MCWNSYRSKRKRDDLKKLLYGANVENDNFWLIMDRNSDNFDARIGEMHYIKAQENLKNMLIQNASMQYHILNKEKIFLLKQNAVLANKTNFF